LAQALPSCDALHLFSIGDRRKGHDEDKKHWNK